MAGASFSIGLTSDVAQLRARLDDELKTLDKHGLNLAIGHLLLNSTLDRFKKGIGPDGKAWPESGRVKAENGRRKKGRPKGKTLVDTARLRNSLHVFADQEIAEVGTDVIYARIHQLGGDTGRGHATHLPARPYLPFDGEGGGFPDEDRDLVMKTIENWIGERLK